MEGFLREFFSSGKRLLDDTKQVKISNPKKRTGEMNPVAETDPHRLFVRRTIAEKPKKADLVKDIQKFIAGAEAEL
jgi:hypothetical protein